MINIIIFMVLSVLLLYGFCHERQIAKFEQLLFTKRGRRILRKNWKELVLTK